MKNYFKITVVTAVALILSSCGINDIPTLDEEAKAAFSQVENQYKRRAELIPNLVSTVKGYAAHEKDTLEAVINARAKATSSQINLPKDILNNPAAFQKFQAAQEGLSGALGKLMVVVERYPELKANDNFLKLQSQLEGTENRISVARRDFILAVKNYNTEIRTFPGRIWHSIMYSDMAIKETFKVTPETRAVPTVKF